MYRRHFSLLLLVVGSVLSLWGQETLISRITLNNNDVFTGKIIEIKPGDIVRIEIAGGNVISIPYGDVKHIQMDAGQKEPVQSATGTKSDKPLKRFYFESHHEFVLGVGAGNVMGLPGEFGQVINDDVFAGLMNAVGVGYGRRWFAGFGFGYLGHKNEPSFAIPYLLDLRCRLLPNHKLSPMVVASAGGVYQEGGLGSFTFSDGIGLSIAFKERLSAHFIANHTYLRLSPGLSLPNDEAEKFFANSYRNYIGIRLGVNFKI